MENIRIDSHKLIYHPERVGKWKEGAIIYPLEIEASLSGTCNHRCVFCALDYLEYIPHFLNTEVWERELKIMSQKGVKSIVYAGEGEPLIHKDATRIIKTTKENGIDVALSTNAALLDVEKSADLLKCLTWMRISIAAATKETYSRIHQCRDTDFDKVLVNIENAVKIKRDNNYNTTIGAQLLLLPENKEEVIQLAKIMKDLGVDYYTVKPYSQHPSSKVKREVNYDEMLDIEKQLQELTTEQFQIFFRNNAIKNIKNEKPYETCYGLNFMTYIDSNGDVYPCCAFVGDVRKNMGNICKTSFVEVWNSKKAVEIRKSYTGCVLQSECRGACRLDEANKYLNELKNLGAHVNFI